MPEGEQQSQEKWCLKVVEFFLWVGLENGHGNRAMSQSEAARHPKIYLGKTKNSREQPSLKLTVRP